MHVLFLELHQTLISLITNMITVLVIVTTNPDLLHLREAYSMNECRSTTRNELMYEISISHFHPILISTSNDLRKLLMCLICRRWFNIQSSLIIDHQATKDSLYNRPTSITRLDHVEIYIQVFKMFNSMCHVYHLWRSSYPIQ